MIASTEKSLIAHPEKTSLRVVDGNSVKLAENPGLRRAVGFSYLSQTCLLTEVLVYNGSVIR